MQKPNKKRNFRQMMSGSSLIQPTLHQYGFDTADKKYKRDLRQMLLEAKHDFDDCLVRLQTVSNLLMNSSLSEQVDERRTHLSLVQRRKRFQQEMMKNPYFQLMARENPHILMKSNVQLKYMFRQRQFMNISQKMQIIELRFGAYGSLKNQQITYSKIALTVGTKVSSVVNVVRRYKQQDAHLKIVEKRGGRPAILNQIQIKEICSEAFLQKWAHLSLEKRCDLINTQYQVKISRYTLAKVYRAHQVSYLKTHKSFYSRFSEEQLISQRMDFISKLAKFLHLGKEVLYMDETSTNVWETKSKMWQPTDTILPMVYQLPQKRGSNVTIIGAISNKRDQIFKKIANTTNTENVLAFFSNLNSKIGLRDKVMVMDNHAAHHSNQVTAYLEKQGAIVLFMPPLSSYFNPIETIWSYIKQKWRNELVQLLGAQPSKRYMNRTLERLCEDTPPLVVTNIANSCIALMRKYFLRHACSQALSDRARL